MSFQTPRSIEEMLTCIHRRANLMPAALSDQHFQRTAAALNIPDTVHRPRMHLGREHTAQRTRSLPIHRGDQHTTATRDPLGGQHVMALKIEQNQRGVDLTRTCNKARSPQQ